MGDIPSSKKYQKNNLMRNSFDLLGDLDKDQKVIKRPGRKYKWLDPLTDHSLSAGGILFYDDTGIWVIGERQQGVIVYTDIGGKYAYEDGNIWTTIRRELYEETYGCCEMFSEDVLMLSKKYPPVYVNGHNKVPVYACLVVPITETLSFRNFGLDPERFSMKRAQTMKENPEVPVNYYSPCELTKLSYKELKDHKRLSYRLQRIIRFSEVINSKIKTAKN